MEEETRCKNCGTLITGENTANRKPCPNCGSTKRQYLGKVPISASASVEAKAEVKTYPEYLLEICASLMENKHHSIALVTADLACGVAVERALARKFENEGKRELGAVVLDSYGSFNLKNESIWRLYKTLTGDETIRDEPFWPDYTPIRSNRNAVMHDRKTFGKQEAENAYNGAKGLVEYLKEHW